MSDILFDDIPVE